MPCLARAARAAAVFLPLLARASQPGGASPTGAAVWEDAALLGGASQPGAAQLPPDPEAEASLLNSGASPDDDADAALLGGNSAGSVQRPKVREEPAAPPVPRKAGCYVWLPGGCQPERHRKRILHAKRHWMRDSWGEANAHAKISRMACNARRHAINAWCQVTDAVMLLVEETEAAAPAAAHEAMPSRARVRWQGGPWAPLPEGAPPLPETTGCFVWLPSGCRARDRFEATSHWKRDEWGEAYMGAGVSASECQRRKDTFDDWCGVQDAVMLMLSP